MSVPEFFGNLRRRWGFYIFIFLLGVGITTLASTMLQPSPIRLLSEAEQDGIAYRGGRIELRVHSLTRRQCLTSTDRDLWRWEVRGGQKVRVIVPLAIRSRVILPMHENTYVLSLDVPGNIDTGLWFYTAQTRFACPWLWSLFNPAAVKTGDIPIPISDAPPDSKPIVLQQNGPMTILPGGQGQTRH